MSVKLLNYIDNLIKPHIQDLGYEIANIQLVKENDQNFLRISIDNAECRISLDDCQKVNDVVDPILDKAYPDPIWDALEISSPGINRTIKTHSEFVKFIGYSVCINLYQKDNGKKEYIGQLNFADENIIKIIYEGMEKTFNKKDIALVKLHATL